MNVPILSVILLAPVLGALAMLFVPAVEQKTIKMLAVIFTFIPAALSVYIYVAYDMSIAGMQFVEHLVWVERLGIHYSLGVDGLSLPLVLLTTIVGFCAIYASWDVVKRVKEFFMFLLLLIAGIIGVFITTDLFWLFIFYEIAVIPTYILIVVWGSTRKEYGGMKLTLYHAIGSAFILIAIIATYLYGAEQLGFATFDIATLATVEYDFGFQKFAFLFMLIGFGVIVPMFPLHTWAPDGHVASPAAVSMLLAGVVMKLGGYGLIRIALSFFPEGALYWAPLIAVLATIAVIYGAMIAMAQKDIKFVIGYSSVSHMGYILLGLAAFNTISITGAVSQMFAHGVMTALFFALVGFLYGRTHTRDFAKLGGLAHQMPKITVAFMIAGMASLGLPGLHNFVAEFLIFIGAYTADPAVLQAGIFSVNIKWLAVIAILGVVITATYVLRVIQFTFFGPRKAEYDHIVDANRVEMVPIVILSGLLLLFGIFPALITDLISSGLEPIMDHITPAITEGISKIGGGL